MKRICQWAAALAASVCLALGSAGAVSVVSDGAPVTFSDATPYLSDAGRVMLPLRAVGGALGCQVGWDEKNGVARVLSPVYAQPQENADEWPWVQGAVYLKPDETAYLFEIIHGTTFTPSTPKGLLPDSAVSAAAVRDHAGDPAHNYALTADTAPVVRDGHIYLPIRTVAELCGFSVRWDDSTQTVTFLSTDALGAPQAASDPDALARVCDLLFPHGDGQTYV